MPSIPRRIPRAGGEKSIDVYLGNTPAAHKQMLEWEAGNMRENIKKTLIRYDCIAGP